MTRSRYSRFLRVGAGTHRVTQVALADCRHFHIQSSQLAETLLVGLAVAAMFDDIRSDPNCCVSRVAAASGFCAKEEGK